MPRQPVRLLAALVLAVACKTKPSDKPATTPPEISAQSSDPGSIEVPLDDGDEPEADGEVAPRPPERRPPPADVGSLGEALDALGRSNPEGAAKFIRGALKKDPADEQLRLALVLALVNTGAYDEAEAVLSEKPAKGKPPSSARVRVHAQLRLLRGDVAGAEAMLSARIAADAGDLPARGDLVALRALTGRAAQSRDLIDALYDAFDAGKATTVDALVAVARAARARGTTGAFQDANMVLGDAERIAAGPAKPGDEPQFIVQDRVLLLRGAIFREKYAASEAADSYDIILKRDPWQPDALAGLAMVHLEELRLAAAAKSAEAALQTNPRHPEAHGVLARIALVEGRRAEALDRVRTQVLKVHPRHPVGLAVVAGAALSADDPAGFKQARDEALTFAPTAFYLALSDLLVSMHLYEQTEVVLAEAVARDAADASLQSAHGLNLLRLGKETEGRAALGKAWKRDRFNERTRNTLDLYDQRIDQHYTDVSDADLRLRLPKEDAEHVQTDYVALIARARKALDQRYGMHPGPLRIEVFADPRDFSVRTIGVPSLGAVGVCFGDLITSVGPYGGTHNFHQVLWHELAHVYAVKLSKGRVPRWFTEGLSEWESEIADPSWARESAELLAEARRAGRLRKLGELDLAFLRATSAIMMEVAYATAAWSMRYLGETYGLPKLTEILKGYATGATTEELFKKHLGKDMPVVEAEFDRWMNARLDATISGWHPTKPGARAKPDARDALYKQAAGQIRGKDFTTAARTLQQLIQKDGDGFRPRMLLGEVLLQGPQWKSAQPHFEKARGFQREAIEPIIRLAEVARRSGDIPAEKQRLRDGLAIDGMSFDPAARLTMLAVITKDDPALALALDRATAIAPLHPLTLAAQSLKAARAGDKPRAQALSKRSLQGIEAIEGKGPTDTLVVLALAAEAAGDLTTAKILATRAAAEKDLPAPAKEAMTRLTTGK
jgi:tetratricopeptide (TPR) repeat protein